MDEKLFVSVDEAVQLIGVSRNSIYRLIAEHRLKSTKIGTRRLILRRSIDELADPAPPTPKRRRPTREAALAA